MNAIETVQALVGALRSFIYDGKAEGWDAALTAGDDFLAQAAQSPAPVAVQPSQWQDIAGWKLVPIEPTEAMLRPFYECPPDELPLAWAAALRIARPPLSASPEDTK